MPQTSLTNVVASHADIIALSSDITTVTVTVANGASLSGVTADLAGNALVGFKCDAAWDTNIVSFQGDYTATVLNLYSEGVEYVIPGVIASTYQAVDPVVFLACRYLKVRSGNAAVPAVQGGDSIITLYLRAIQ